MPSDTRQRLIDHARGLFYAEGFRSVGLDRVLAAVGISKTAFYKHFASKEALMAAVLEEQSRRIQADLQDRVRERAGRSARDQLHAVLDVIEQIMEQDGFHGCIFVNAAMEFPEATDPAHRAAAANHAALETLVHDIAERAHARDPAALAAELCLVIEGCYVTRSLTGDPGTIDVARALADRLIASHLPEAGTVG